MSLGMNLCPAQAAPPGMLPNVSALQQKLRDNATGPSGSARQTAREVKASPVYNVPSDTRQSANWIQRGLARLGEVIGSLLNPKAMPNLNAPTAQIGNGLTVVMWGILVAVVLVGLGLVIRHFRWTKRTKIRAGGLLEEDEPDRSADEWLLRADALEREGRHREAVRCLYLASLARIDEAGVARFIRAETNWEHLRRIEASSKRPSGLDFRSPTQRFDRIWYGHQVEGSRDVAIARQNYEEICQQLAVA